MVSSGAWWVAEVGVCQWRGHLHMAAACVFYCSWSDVCHTVDQWPSTKHGFEASIFKANASDLRGQGENQANGLQNQNRASSLRGQGQGQGKTFSRLRLRSRPRFLSSSCLWGWGQSSMTPSLPPTLFLKVHKHTATAQATGTCVCVLLLVMTCVQLLQLTTHVASGSSLCDRCETDEIRALRRYYFSLNLASLFNHT